MEYQKKSRVVRGGGRVNPVLINELNKLSFVLTDGTILSNDAHAVILSMIDEFNRCASTELKHNIEMSHKYFPGKGLVSDKGGFSCTDCDLVLKYDSSNVCLDKSGQKECTSRRGSIKFALKRYYEDKGEKICKYTDIKVVKIMGPDSVEPLSELYINDDEMKKIHELKDVALSKVQSEKLKQTLESGKKGVSEMISKVDQLVKESKRASSGIEVSSLKQALSSLPAIDDVKIANKMSLILNKLPPNYKVILVPGRHSIPLKDSTPTEIEPGTEKVIHESSPSIAVDVSLAATESSGKSLPESSGQIIPVTSTLSVLTSSPPSASDKSLFPAALTTSSPSVDKTILERLGKQLKNIQTEAQNLFSSISTSTLTTAESLKKDPITTLSPMTTEISAFAKSEPYSEYLKSVSAALSQEKAKPLITSVQESVKPAVSSIQSAPEKIKPVVKKINEQVTELSLNLPTTTEALTKKLSDVSVTTTEKR